MPIRSQDVRWFSELVLRLHGSLTDRELFQALLPAIHLRFGSIVSHADELSWDQSTFRQHGVHGGLDPPKDYVPASEDHPLVIRLWTTHRLETMHRAVLSPWTDFTRTNFYNVLFRPYGMRDQLLAAISGGPDFVTCFGVSRDTDFAPEEAALMEAVRRHAEACLIRVRRCGPVTETFGPPKILLGHDLRPIQIAPPIRKVLAMYFPGSTAKTRQRELPDALFRWVVWALTVVERRPPPAPLTAFSIESARGRLVFRLFPNQSYGHLLLLREDLNLTGALAFRDHGMTVRECEVLHWLMAGKRDAEIAMILGSTTRTVGKHVQCILRKLQVKSRVAAARFADVWSGGDGARNRPGS